MSQSVFANGYARHEGGLKMLLEAISKNGFWFKVKAGASFEPEEYYRILRIWSALQLVVFFTEAIYSPI